MAAPVVVTGLTATVTLTDSEGKTLGTAEAPLEVSSSELKAAVGDMVEETRKVRELLEEVIFS